MQANGHSTRVSMSLMPLSRISRSRVSCWACCTSPLAYPMLRLLHCFPRAQHAVHRRDSETSSEEGPIAGAWATREDLLDTKKVRSPSRLLVLTVTIAVLLAKD